MHGMQWAGGCSKEAGAHLQPRCFGRHVEVPELLEGLLPQEPRRDGGIHLRHRRRAGAGAALSAAPPPRWRVSAAALPMACTSVTALQPRGPRHGAAWDCANHSAHQGMQLGGGVPAKRMILKRMARLRRHGSPACSMQPPLAQDCTVGRGQQLVPQDCCCPRSEGGVKGRTT